MHYTNIFYIMPCIHVFLYLYNYEIIAVYLPLKSIFFMLTDSSLKSKLLSSIRRLHQLTVIFQFKYLTLLYDSLQGKQYLL